MLNEYKNMLKVLLTNINTLKPILKENEASQTLESINNLEKKIKEENFLVVSFGGFSSGKTTFLNALMGNRLLPAKTLPTTATINYLLYNKKPYAEIQFKDKKLLQEDKNSGIEELKKIDLKFNQLGKKKIIKIDEIEQFVADSKISPYVKEVFLNYPSDVLTNGLIFVDTPGTDSVIKSHKRISYSFIEKADVILFFIWGPRPFTTSDFEFLSDIKSLRKFIKEDKFFFILNAIDNIDEQPVDEVISYVHDVLVKKSGIKNPNIIPISSRLALYYKLYKNNLIDKDDQYLKKLLRFNTEDENINSLWEKSNFESIENRISDYLIKAKGEILIKKVKDIIFHVVDNSLNHILIEEQTFQKSIEEVESEINDVLLPLLEEQRKEKDRLVKYAVSHIKEIKKSIKYSDIKNTIEKLANAKLKEEIDFYEYSRQLNYVSMELKQQIEGGLQDILDTIITEMNEIMKNIQGAINQNFNISLNMAVDINFDPDMNISIPEMHSSSADDDGSLLGLGLLGGVLGLFFGAGAIGGFLLGASAVAMFAGEDGSSVSMSIEEIKEKIFGTINSKIKTIKSDIDNKLNDASDEISTSISDTFDLVLNKIESELNSIKERRRKFDNKFKERKKNLDSWTNDLKQIKTNLDNLISFQEES